VVGCAYEVVGCGYAGGGRECCGVKGGRGHCSGSPLVTTTRCWWPQIDFLSNLQKKYLKRSRKSKNKLIPEVLKTARFLGTKNRQRRLSSEQPTALA